MEDEFAEAKPEDSEELEEEEDLPLLPPENE